MKIDYVGDLVMSKTIFHLKLTKSVTFCFCNCGGCGKFLFVGCTKVNKNVRCKKCLDWNVL